jgi:hypothetical protein
MRQNKRSAVGQKQTSRHVRVMSVILLKADIHQRGWNVRYVPQADIPIRRSATSGVSAWTRAILVCST